jgi:hypothetical protein
MAVTIRSSRSKSVLLESGAALAVLSTDLDLDADQVHALRIVDERSRSMAQGKTPVLTHG